MKTDEKLLHEKFVTFGANAKAWMKQCVLLLPDIEKHQIWQKKGFGSIYEYAAKLAGMSKNTLETYVREYKKQKGFAFGTALDEPVERNSALDSRPGTEFQSKEESESSVKAAADVEMTSAANVEIVTISMNLDRETAETLHKLKGQGDWNTLMQELLTLREEKLKAEEPEPVVTTTRYIPARIKKYVLKKTNGQCAYPGCVKSYKILHHTQRFALRHMHDSKTLVPLCKSHEQLAHQGLIANEQKGPGNWRVREEADRDKMTYVIDRKVMQFRKL